MVLNHSMKSSETMGFSVGEWMKYCVLFFIFGLTMIIIANYVAKFLGLILILILIVMMYSSFHILRYLKQKEVLGFTKLSKGRLMPKPKIYDKVMPSRKNLNTISLF